MLEAWMVARSRCQRRRRPVAVAVALVSAFLVVALFATDGSLAAPFRREKEQPAVMVFAPPKSGSTLIEKILRFAAHRQKLCHFGTFTKRLTCSTSARCLGTRAPYRTVDAITRKCDGWILDNLKTLRTRRKYEIQAPPGRASAALNAYGFIWGPIKTSTSHTVDPIALDEAVDALVSAGFKPVMIFHHRHPLDLLVSEYHTFQRSHEEWFKMYSRTNGQDYHGKREFTNDTTIDEFVLEQLTGNVWWEKRYGDLFHMIDQRHKHGEREDVQVIISKYHEMVGEFEVWVKAILSAVLVGDTQSDIKDLAMVLNHQFKTTFQPDGFSKHAVFPGQYLKELKKSTIVRIEQEHKHFIKRLGYDLTYPEDEYTKKRPAHAKMGNIFTDYDDDDDGDDGNNGLAGPGGNKHSANGSGDDDDMDISRLDIIETEKRALANMDTGATDDSRDSRDRTAASANGREQLQRNDGGSSLLKEQDRVSSKTFGSVNDDDDNGTADDDDGAFSTKAEGSKKQNPGVLHF